MKHINPCIEVYFNVYLYTYFEKYFQKLAFPFGLYYNNDWISFSVGRTASCEETWKLVKGPPEAEK